MIRAWIAGVGVWGPGMAGWEAARAVLRGEADEGAEAAPPAPAFLAPNERRRVGAAVRLALAVAQEAAAMAGRDPAGLRSVFATANGDGALVHAILETLAEPGRPLSPTQFHNSVHNAAAGYWTIGHHARAPADCLGCHDASFAAGLLKAAAEAATEREPVLLCCYDAPLPSPLDAMRRGGAAFASAFVLTPEPCAGALGRIEVDYAAEPDAAWPDAPRAAALGALYAGNPAARSLRLLESLALGAEDRFEVGMLDGAVRVGFAP
ncbi:MAG: beta-ketoacyl synthase chain length factor [Proteobacteria bacterium]|nr:beta-ketoacyl synthase chain length factor [Pseudomonadota bacterium]